MSRAVCPQEYEVARAVRTGLRDDQLTRHARECAACHQVVAVAHAMQGLARHERVHAAAAPLDDASLLWWKHKLIERYTNSERAQAPIRIIDALAGVLGLCAITVCAVAASLTVSTAFESAISGLMSRMLASWLTGEFSVAVETSGAGLTVAAGAVAFAAALLNPRWDEA